MRRPSVCVSRAQLSLTTTTSPPLSFPTTQPVTVPDGNAINEPSFQAFLDFTRATAHNSQPASLTAGAHVQLLTMVHPPPNVAAGSYKPGDRLRGTVDTIRVVVDLENAQSAFPFVVGGPSLAAPASLGTDKQVAVSEARLGWRRGFDECGLMLTNDVDVEEKKHFWEQVWGPSL